MLCDCLQYLSQKVMYKSTFGDQLWQFVSYFYSLTNITAELASEDEEIRPSNSLARLPSLVVKTVVKAIDDAVVEADNHVVSDRLDLAVEATQSGQGG
jgi:hypothetical protein